MVIRQLLEPDRAGGFRVDSGRSTMNLDVKGIHRFSLETVSNVGYCLCAKIPSCFELSAAWLCGSRRLLAAHIQMRHIPLKPLQLRGLLARAR